MPVTLTTASHPSTEWESLEMLGPDELLKHSCCEDYRKCKSIIQHSFNDQLFKESHISPSENGFVRAVFNAYSHHHHLTLRPEDVWLAILTQFSFFVNAHSEELRPHFVAHEGKKKLEVTTVGKIHTFDFNDMAMRMTKLIEENVVDTELRAWIMPNFATTTETDEVVAAIVMMGSLQKYFDYSCRLLCGIPTVTLLGERADWEAILQRVDKLPQFGEQPAQFAELLRPVLRRFMTSYDNPTNPDILDFWARCVHKESFGSGADELSGWITAFCFWTDEGHSLYRLTHLEFPLGQDKTDTGCELDGVLFHKIEVPSIPSAFASVPLTVDDNGTEIDTMLLAGLVGIQATSGVPMSDNHSDRRPDSIQPLSGWWMYEKSTSEDIPNESLK